MIDATTYLSQSQSCKGAAELVDRADMFVNGEHTAANQETWDIAVQLLIEIDVLDFEPDLSKLNKRDTKRLRKLVCFMSSFLHCACLVQNFSIQMNRHRWTGTSCGYAAARAVCNGLVNAGFIIKIRDPHKGRRATIFSCSDVLKKRIDGWREVLCFKRANPPLIEVRSAKIRECGRLKGGHPIPLSEFSQENVHRNQKALCQINEHLSAHSLVDRAGRPVDTQLTRIFSRDMQSGGRLYASYQFLPEIQRLQCMLDGEPVCEIDMKASHISIAAALYRSPERLSRDPYSEIPGIKTRLQRKGAKIIIQCIVHKPGGRPRSLPRSNGKVPFKEKYGFKDKEIADLLSAAFNVFPFLDGSPSLTMVLQYLEAEIILDVLLQLIRRKISAYPIHDSLLVKQSDKDVVLRVLQETLKKYLGPYAPWLDLAAEGQRVEFIQPLSCPMDAPYLLKDELDKHTDQSTVTVEYGKKMDWGTEGDFMVIDLEDDGDF